MRPHSVFSNLGQSAGPFWSLVKIISQEAGYTVRGEGLIKVPTQREMIEALRSNGLGTHWLDRGAIEGKSYYDLLRDYFQYRATTLNTIVEPSLMDVNDAKAMYDRVYERLRSTVTCPLPQNKQKGEKKGPNFLTCVTNMIIAESLMGMECDYDPRGLAVITHGETPVFTLSRRMDGAFPSTLNPIAVWEIKEYYYTTTFGSRVADGIYETLLDGMEINQSELHYTSAVKQALDPNASQTVFRPLHYLIVDSHFTWWVCGRSYLCRIIDLLNMNYLDAVIFGKSVESELPPIVKEWAAIHTMRLKTAKG